MIEKLLIRDDFENDGTINRTVTYRARVQSEAGVKALGLIRFVYDNRRERMTPTVRVRHADGTVVMSPTEEIQEITADISREAPMYTDIREKHVPVKGLRTGDVLEYEVQDRTSTPLIPGHFFITYTFERNDIVLEESYTATFPAGRAVTILSPDRKPTRREEQGRTILVWTSSNLKRPSSKDIDRVRFADVRLTTFVDWKELGDWYATLMAERAEPTPDITAKVIELTKDSALAEDKIRKIYDFVSTRFRYISVNLGIGSVQPHAAGEVFRNGYGDCKDKHTLLSAMLKAIGIRSIPALTLANKYARDEHFPEFPAPPALDHVMTVAELPGNKTLWMDSTSEVAPFQALLPVFRGNFALLARPDGRSTLEKAPDALPYPAKETFQVVGKLGEDGTMVAKVERTFRSDAEIGLRSAYHHLPRSQWEALTQQFSLASGFGGEVTNVTVSEPEDLLNPFKISYDYKRLKYSDWENLQLTPPLPPTLRFNLAEFAKVKEALPLGNAGLELDYHAEVELWPNEKIAVQVPLELENDILGYRSSYELRGSKWLANRNLRLKLAEIPPERVAAIRELSEKINRHESEYQALYARGDRPEQHFGSDLFGPARAKLQGLAGKDPAAAAQFMRSKVAEEPEILIWRIMLATFLRQSGRIREAKDELRQAAQLEPQRAVELKGLGFALMSEAMYPEAESVWKRFIKLSPDDGDGPGNLSQVFMKTGRHQEAAEMLEAALQKTPNNISYLNGLAETRFRLGQDDLALAALEKALTLDDSGSASNNVAYQLAEKGKFLARADELSHATVKKAEEECSEIALEDLEQQDLARMHALEAAWDTQGWIYHRRNDPDNAIVYLQAAWALSQDPEISFHLAEVYVSQGKSLLANRYYANAAAMPKGHAESRQVLVKRVGAAVAERLIGNSRTGLTEERTLKLPQLERTFMSADYFFLFTPSGLAGFKKVSGADIRGIDKAIQDAKWRIPFPPGSATRILRRGIVVCSNISGCNLVLQQADDVKDLE
ncbi:MAG: DUF3857 domain-containing protein [Acidobacteriales bacterium]|nr:DUF3857 domain-containing protein [Terriglobales bacterium]